MTENEYVKRLEKEINTLRQMVKTLQDRAVIRERSKKQKRKDFWLPIFFGTAAAVVPGFFVFMLAVAFITPDTPLYRFVSYMTPALVGALFCRIFTKDLTKI